MAELDLIIWWKGLKEAAQQITLGIFLSPGEVRKIPIGYFSMGTRDQQCDRRSLPFSPALLHVMVRFAWFFPQESWSMEWGSELEQVPCDFT